MLAAARLFAIAALATLLLAPLAMRAGYELGRLMFP